MEKMTKTLILILILIFTAVRMSNRIYGKF